MKALCQDDDSGGVRIAPLIDIVFLLLIFFLVATTFYEAEKDITIRLASATEGKERSRGPDRIVINVGAAGIIVVNQRVVSTDELEQLLAEAKRLNDQVAAIIRCDRQTRHADFVKVLNLCERTRLLQVAVAAVQEND